MSDADPDADPMVTTYSDGAEGLLEDCAQVVVVPPPPTPFVTLTTNGEYQGPDESAGETGEPLIVDANLKDGYQPDEEFVYKMTVENAGLALAEDIVIEATLNNNVVRFNGTASLYIDDDGDFTAARLHRPGPAEQRQVTPSRSRPTSKPAERTTCLPVISTAS
ncbi:MAG: hypothetical protein U5J97_02085 [Trueperaceae bacterium]|nr:hypothetical protein [Trueperaceae bacterium]